MEKYCLRWNEFETNVRQFFEKLRKEQNLFDVSLVSEDGHSMKAHRMILSAGSQFFKNIFDSNEDKNMLIYLKGVKGDKLKSMLDFLYNGEVNVAQDDLDNFLSVASEMKLTGLERKTGNFEEKDTEDSTVIKSNSKQFPDYFNEIYESKPEMCENKDNFTTSNSIIDVTEDYLDNVGSYEQHEQMKNEDLKLRIENIIEKKEFGKWTCKVCEKIYNRKSHASDHAEVHIEGMKHICQFCNKVFQKSCSLRWHVIKAHKKTKM